MATQLDLFDTESRVPEGFKYQRDIITPDTETALLAAIGELPFSDLEFKGYVGKRRTVSFGWSYDFMHEQLQPADDMPSFLLALRQPAAAFAGIPADQLHQVLVTEYNVGAGIGWHRDKAVFGDVVGISLLAPCRFRLRRAVANTWERITIDAGRRSAYLLSGPARTEWEHSIPGVESLRYSITYRSLR